MLCEVEVLIVGAGPVGLMLGCELARRGITHRIVEAKSSRERYCKAIGVSPRTLEILDHQGLLDEARRLGFFFQGMAVVCQDEVVKRLTLQDDGLPYGAFAMAQPDMEEILEGLWSRYGHSIVRGLSVTGFEQDSEGVSASLSDGQTVRSRYLVGCDGAHSLVRKTLGTGFEGERFERTFLLCDVRLNWDHPHPYNWQYIQLEDGEFRGVVTVIANPTGPGRYRVSSSVDDSFDCPEHPSLELMREILEPALPAGTEMSDMRWSSRYNISHRIASAYRTGRVFLAGDAAHIHPPIGGLGMNTGLQDAYNLGWKLAAVCQGRLSEEILETYHGERHPVGSMVVQVTAARMARAMAGQQEDSQGQAEPPLFDTQLNVRYQPGLLVAGESLSGLPRPGDRLPCVEGLKRPYVAGHARLAELFRDGRFHLFTQQVDHASFGQAARAALGDLVRDWAILTTIPEEAMGFLVDSVGQWKSAVGSGAVLVRPDGVIGWRGSDLDAFQRWLAGFTGQ
jgi:2-polyprenyl-6-methoxyphenol hydroxylase-like FAD-dependent oxidoreductase